MHAEVRAAVLQAVRPTDPADDRRQFEAERDRHDVEESEGLELVRERRWLRPNF